MHAEESRFLLASGSPRRREMLRDLGLNFEACGLDVDESIHQGESANSYVQRVTLAKVSAGEARARSDGLGITAVIAADTVVVLDDVVLGKPTNRGEALSMVSQLTGRSHQVMTSYGILRLMDSKLMTRTVSTTVTFRDASPVEVANYVATGEGDDKAGAYAIQGIGAFLVSEISGSYSNVVGLPICELVVDLKALGYLREYP